MPTSEVKRVLVPVDFRKIDRSKLTDLTGTVRINPMIFGNEPNAIEMSSRVSQTV